MTAKLTIRADQLVALRAPGYDVLAERLVARLRSRHAHVVERMSDEKLFALVRAGVDRCDRHGITVTRDITRFVDLLVVHGWSFDLDQPWARQVLGASAGRDRRPKIERLVEAAARHDGTSRAP